MVGSLSLPNVCEGDPLDVMSCGADRGLDSPDSGLPPSPSPSAWLLPGTAEKAGGQGSEDEGRVGGSALKVPSNFFFFFFATLGSTEAALHEEISPSITGVILVTTNI